MNCAKCGTQNGEGAQVCQSCGAVLGVPPPAPSTTRLVLPASLGQRLLNLLIDGIARPLLTALVYFVLVLGTGGNIVIASIAAVILLIGYDFIFEALFQQTIGKMITGTKVVTTAGEKPNFMTLLGRTLCRCIPFEPLSFLFYGSYPTKGWHDRFSGTLVVPKLLSPEEVRAIDPKRISAEAPHNNVVLIVVIVICAIFFGIIILGVLSATVLTSLEQARSAGNEASIKATVSMGRATAEIYYSSNNDSYAGVCNDPQMMSLVSSITNNKSTAVCNDSETAYVLSAKLSDSTSYCVDNTSFSGMIEKLITTELSCGMTPGVPTEMDIPSSI